jgi:hypothetical protein
MALIMSEDEHVEVILLSGGRSQREVAEVFNTSSRTAPNHPHLCGQVCGEVQGDGVGVG